MSEDNYKLYQLGTLVVTKSVHEFVASYVHGDTSWDEQGRLNVDGNVDIRTYDGDLLPVRFGKVGNFCIADAPNLVSLAGCPHTSKTFCIAWAPKLQSLEHITTNIKGPCMISRTAVEDVGRIDKYLKGLDGYLTFYTRNDAVLKGLIRVVHIEGLTAINLNKSADGVKEVLTPYLRTGQIHEAQEALLDAGLIDWADV